MKGFDAKGNEIELWEPTQKYSREDGACMAAAAKLAARIGNLAAQPQPEAYRIKIKRAHNLVQLAAHILYGLSEGSPEEVLKVLNQ